MMVYTESLQNQKQGEYPEYYGIGIPPAQHKQLCCYIGQERKKKKGNGRAANWQSGKYY
jgi:hypothetical protein